MSRRVDPYTLVFTLKRFPAHPSDRREGEGERTVAPGSTTTRRLVKDQRLWFDYKYTIAARVEPSAFNEGDDFDVFLSCACHSRETQ